MMILMFTHQCPFSIQQIVMSYKNFVWSNRIHVTALHDQNTKIWQSYVKKKVIRLQLHYIVKMGIQSGLQWFN